MMVAWYCRDETQRYSGSASKLTSDEARRIGKAMSRMPEFLMQHRTLLAWGRAAMARRPTKS